MDAGIFVWIVYGLWVGVVAYLAVTGAGAKRDTQPHLGQSLGLLAVIVAAFALPQLPLFRFLNFAPVSPVLGATGVVLAAAGWACLVWARRTLGRNWSQTVAAKVGHELVTSGPYRWVRHPMYAGGELACLGSTIAAGGPFVLLLVMLTPVFLWRVGAEDQLLARQFPSDFPEYRRRTKALIPFVW